MLLKHISKRKRHQRMAAGFICCFSQSDLWDITIFSPVSVFWGTAGVEEDRGSVFFVVFCLCSRSSSKSSNESSTLSVKHKEHLTSSCLTSGFQDAFFPTKVLFKAQPSWCVFIPSSGGGGGSRPPPSSSEPHAAWKWSKWRKSFLKTLMNPFDLLDAVKRRSVFALTQKAELLVSSCCGGRSRTGLFLLRNHFLCKNTYFNVLKTVLWESNHC